MAYTYEQLLQMGAKPVETAVPAQKSFSYEDLIAMGATPVTAPTQKPVYNPFSNKIETQPETPAQQIQSSVGENAKGFIKGTKAALGGVASGVGGIGLTAIDYAGRKLVNKFGSDQAKANLSAAPTLNEQLRQQQGGNEYPTAFGAGQVVGGLATFGAPAAAVGKTAGALAKGYGAGKKVAKATELAAEGLAFAGASSLAENRAYTAKDYALNAIIPVGISGVGSAYKWGKNLINVPKTIDKLETKYYEWAGATKPGKRNLGKIETKTSMLNAAGTEGVTPMRHLAENGVVPQIQGTKFNTFEQAKSYADSTRPFKNTLREALSEAELAVPPTPIDAIEQQAIQFARTPKNINSGRAAKMEAEIRKEFDLLRQEYPEGTLPLTVQDDIKSARWDNVFGNKSIIEQDRLLKDSEYAIASAFQKNIQNAAEQAGYSEVAQLNREIGDRLGAAKFLDSLDGQTLKGGKLGKFVGTVIGSSLGNNVPSSILGALGGNFVAQKLIESSVESPIRRIILKRIATENPKAYQETLEWLAKQDALRANRLALPAPSSIPMGGITKEGYAVNQAGEKTIIPTTAEIIPAEKYPTSVNPKTGKFQKVYMSGQSKSPTAQQTTSAMTTAANIPEVSTTPIKKSNKKLPPRKK